MNFLKRFKNNDFSAFFVKILQKSAIKYANANSLEKQTSTWKTFRLQEINAIKSVERLFGRKIYNSRSLCGQNYTQNCTYI